jgi:hypothetical protein
MRTICKKTVSFLSFLYVCPEPVLVKRSFLYINGSKRPFSYLRWASEATEFGRRCGPCVGHPLPGFGDLLDVEVRVPAPDRHECFVAPIQAIFGGGDVALAPRLYERKLATMAHALDTHHLCHFSCCGAGVISF